MTSKILILMGFVAVSGIGIEAELNNIIINSIDVEFEPSSRAVTPMIVLHGGAGTITGDAIEKKYNGTKAAARAAYAVLDEGGSAIDAVKAAIMVLEDDAAFNAGKGSCLTQAGHVENDASIMDGSDLSAGTVASISGIKNPILAALEVMTATPHVQLAGDRATEWCEGQGLETADEDYFITEPKLQLYHSWLEDHDIDLTAADRTGLPVNFPLDKWAGQKGTVGAVAIDALGNIAAGTSTGGITGKLPGRVGDTPGVGHGVFADNLSAGVSCTGDGESFMKIGVARRVSYNIGDKGMNPFDAITEALTTMTERVGGDGGIITIAQSGQAGISWNSEQMSWAYARDGVLHYGVNPEDNFQEEV